MSKQLPCLYTTQKLKKKKLFHDGFLKLYESRCSISLYRSNPQIATMESCLESRSLSKEEVNLILSGCLPEIEFEGYLVQIDDVLLNEASVNNNKKENADTISKPKMPFKPPTRVQPKEATIPLAPIVPMQNKNVFTGIKRRTTGGAYEIADDELDDIWTLQQQQQQEEKTPLPSQQQQQQQHVDQTGRINQPMGNKRAKYSYLDSSSSDSDSDSGVNHVNSSAGVQREISIHTYNNTQPSEPVQLCLQLPVPVCGETKKINIWGEDSDDE